MSSNVGASWVCEHRFALAAAEINRFLDALICLVQGAQIGGFGFGAPARKVMQIDAMLDDRNRAGQP